MSKKGSPSRFRAFFSFDAAFALLYATILILLFSALCESASSLLREGALDSSMRLRSLRLSGEALYALEEKGESFIRSGHHQEWVVSPGKAQSLDAKKLSEVSFSNFTSVSISNGAQTLYSSSYGTARPGTYCSYRFAVLSGKPVRLEACIS